MLMTLSLFIIGVFGTFSIMTTVDESHSWIGVFVLIVALIIVLIVLRMG